MSKYELHTSLYSPHQEDGVKWMNQMENQLNGPKGGFLCDEMGLGKTVQIIATILKNPKQHTLIVVPKTLVLQWKSEIKKFAPGLDVLVYDGKNKTNDTNGISLYDIVVTSYPTVCSKKSTLHALTWDRIVLDEAHEIRNRKTQTFKKINALKSSIRWIVTGTPVFNSMEDFVSLCEFVGFSKNTVQAMHDKIKDIYILRRTKADGHISLPFCHFENVELDMFDEERKLYECAFAEAQDSITQVMRESISLHRRNMHMLECLLRMRQLMRWPQLYFDGVAKSGEQIPEIWTHSTHKMSRLFQELASHPTEKAVIFCTFKGELDYIEKQLACPTFRIDGNVEKDERQRQVELFDNAPDNSVMLAQIKCGGVGLNIQCATRVYIMAPSWNPATELQAIGRCHRSGQINDVFVKKLVYKDTPIARSVEFAMMSLQGHKSILCADVLNDKRVEDQIPIRQEKTMDAIRKIFRA